MSEYAGSNWIELQYPEKAMSPLGKNVADLLGELFQGIYPLDHKALSRVDWSNNNFIELSLGWHSMATTDFDELTRLVFLAHHMAIRVSIEASTHKYLKFIFHQRNRNGGLSARHPTLDEAVAQFRVDMVHADIPEYQDPVEEKQPMEVADFSEK
jgi:hypothetical protein